MPKLKTVQHNLQQFTKQTIDDNVFHLAASLAYSTLLTLVPFLIVIFYILSLFPIFNGLGNKIQYLLLQYFVSGLSHSINQQLNHFVSQMSQLKLINIGALVVVNLLMMHALVSAFDQIWHTKMKYSIAISSLLHILTLLLAPIIFACLLLLGPYLASLHFAHLHRIGEHVIQTIKQPLSPLLPHFSAFVVFTLFNWLIPSAKVKFKYAVLCGFVTMLFFELAKSLFIVYLGHVHTYQLIYGTLATIPLFLFWIYISWTVILLGAVLCYRLHESERNIIKNN